MRYSIKSSYMPNAVSIEAQEASRAEYILSSHTTFPLAQCLQHIQYVFTSKKTAIWTPSSSTGAAVREEFMGPMLGPEACGEGPHSTSHDRT